eukprot:m.20437 g.20437  ORF g.20437 m.20437 type:complete len:367 (-) comp7836_c0_seq1:27-1127(-)
MADFHTLPPFVNDLERASSLRGSEQPRAGSQALLSEHPSSEDHEDESVNGEEVEKKAVAGATGSDGHLHGEAEEVDLKVDDGGKKYRVFLGDNIHLQSEFPEGTVVQWRFQSQPHAGTEPVLHLTNITAAQLGEYECANTTGTVFRCTLVKNKSPFKFCENCHRRVHAHSKHCKKCGSTLHAKARPRKRKCESITSKNFEDAIIEKLRSFREVHGEDVDTVLIVSRRHYHRTLTTLHASTGAARGFLQQTPTPGGPTIERSLTDAWNHWLDHHHSSSRATTSRRVDPSPLPQLDSSLNALARMLQPTQPPPPPNFQSFLEPFPNEPLPPSLSSSNDPQLQSIPLLDQTILPATLMPLASAFSFPPS